MLKKYENLNELKIDIQYFINDNYSNKESDFPIILDLIDMESMLKKLKITDRIIAFKIIHETYIAFSNYLIDNLKKMYGEEQEKIINHYKISILPMFEKRLEQINELIVLYYTYEKLPFNVNEIYEVINWNSSYCSITGESFSSTDIKSKKLKIVENIKFFTSYDAFILGITSYLFFKDTSGIPFITVKPIYGSYKNSVIHMRIDKIKNHF